MSDMIYPEYAHASEIADNYFGNVQSIKESFQDTEDKSVAKSLSRNP
jgi:hypothetical protein